MRSARKISAFLVAAAATVLVATPSVDASGTYDFTIPIYSVATAWVTATADAEGPYNEGGYIVWDYGASASANADPIVVGADINISGVISTFITAGTGYWTDVLSYGGPVDTSWDYYGSGGTTLPQVHAEESYYIDDPVTTTTTSGFHIDADISGIFTPVYCQVYSAVDFGGETFDGEPPSVSASNTVILLAQCNDEIKLYNWFGSDPSDYFDTSNWSQGVAPNGVDAVAMLGYQDSGRTTPQPATTVTLSSNLTLGTLFFDNPNTYTVNGPGTLTMQASSGDAGIYVNQGSHVINAAVSFASNTDFYIASGAQLSLTSDITTSSAISVSGGGELVLPNVTISSAGSLVISAGTVSVSSLTATGSATISLTGNYDGSATQLNCSGDEAIGITSGDTATFNQFGGTNTTSVITLGAVGSGTYNLTAGSLSCTSLSIGTGGGGSTSAFNQSGGSVNVTTLTLTGIGSATRTYSLSGGTLTATTETLGTGGTYTNAVFSQSGGSNSVSGNLKMGNNSYLGDNGTYYLTGGSLTVGGTITIYGSTGGVTGGTFEYDGGTLTGNVDNYGIFNVRGGGTETLTGNFINELGATIKTYSTIFDVTGTFTDNGNFYSDPATNRFSTLNVGPGGDLTGSIGDKFYVSGNLLSNSQNNAGWNTVGAALFFAGGDGKHVFDVTGADVGPSSDGFDNNFAWGALSLAAGESLELDDAGNALGALYVGTLSLGGGLSQLAEISANDVNVYYVASLNPWLNDGSYALSGGGELLPIQGFGDQAALLQGANLVSLPEPTSLGLLSFAALPMLRRRRA